MKEQFIQFLINQGYSERTPSGNPSTVYDYPHRIDRICKWENTTWEGLAQKIGTIIRQYDAGGSKEDIGRKSKRAVINALKRYSEFLEAK